MPAFETKLDERQSFEEYEAIAAALKPYIEAARTGDGKVSRGAFMDHARIVGSVKGEYYDPDADAFAEIVNQSGPSPAVKHRIVWVDVSGPAAAAKVEFLDWGGLRYTDFFVLYRKDGEWKISGKVYDSHTNN